MQTKQLFENQQIKKIKNIKELNKNIVDTSTKKVALVNNQETVQYQPVKKEDPITSFDNVLKMEVPEPNFFVPFEFPDNTSLELKTFTSDTVMNMYQAKTIPDLYNTINADIYKQYKNNDYML